MTTTVSRTDGEELDLHAVSEVLLSFLKEKERVAHIIELLCGGTIKPKKLDADTIHSGYCYLANVMTEPKTEENRIKKIYPCKVIQVDKKGFFFKKPYYFFVLTMNQYTSMIQTYEEEKNLTLHGCLYGEGDIVIRVGQYEALDGLVEYTYNKKTVCLCVMEGD